MLARNDLADYIQDTYGVCACPDGCACLRNGWIGRACHYWHPVRATNWEELRKVMQAFGQSGVKETRDVTERNPQN